MGYLLALLNPPLSTSGLRDLADWMAPEGRRDPLGLLRLRRIQVSGRSLYVER